MEDEMSEQLDRVEQKVDKITILLAGDSEFGTKGMIAKQSRNSERLSKLEDAYKRIAWLGGLGTTALGILVIFKDEIIKWLFK